MGGDHAPGPIVDGAVASARHLPLGLLLAGPREVVERELARHADALSLDITILDAPDVIGMAEAPAQALRRKPRASIRLAAEAVADGRAVAMFSAGSTGASVMAAYAGFGLLPGVDRPALATTIPTEPAPRCCSMPVRTSSAGRSISCSSRPWAPSTPASRWACSIRAWASSPSVKRRARAPTSSARRTSC